VFRATASFMRTVVTRNTGWDKFLAGSNDALTEKQRRGARLFFTPADRGGAGCYGCHSGPMLNKQVNDPDVTGVGQFVEENFYNLGLGDHPVQALNRAVRNDPNFRDDGRREITGRDSDAFKFRVVTLRQLKDARLFFHNGALTSVREVVQYFNAGVPQDPVAGAADTLSERFTHPRGPGSAPGLGLSDGQVDALTDFIENGLYDAAFVHHDPKSSTRTFQLNDQDFNYSKHRPDLATLRAVDGLPIDGRPPSGLPEDNNDPLSRRDAGLEFLDVTGQTHVTLLRSEPRGARVRTDVQRIANNSLSVVDTHLLVIVQGLERGVRLANASGVTSGGDPYLRVFLPDGVLRPGQSIVERLVLEGPAHARVNYSLKLLSGQGNP